MCRVSAHKPVVPNFNPRTREGCDLRKELDGYALSNISIHAPVKGATSSLDSAMARCIDISIHAPVKGATQRGDAGRQRNARISIHAPVKGATSCLVFSMFSCQNFNPRTREGCDNAANGQAQGTEVISIHAPVKGATTDEDD